MSVCVGFSTFVSAGEFARIIDATYAYGNWKGGHDFQHRGARLRALLLSGWTRILSQAMHRPHVQGYFCSGAASVRRAT